MSARAHSYFSFKGVFLQPLFLSSYKTSLCEVRYLEAFLQIALLFFYILYHTRSQCLSRPADKPMPVIEFLPSLGTHKTQHHRCSRFGNLLHIGLKSLKNPASDVLPLGTRYHHQILYIADYRAVSDNSPHANRSAVLICAHIDKRILNRHLRLSVGQFFPIDLFPEPEIGLNIQFIFH